MKKEQDEIQQYDFDENGRMVPRQQAKQHSEERNAQILSDQALACIMTILQNGIQEQRDITDDLRSLDFIPAGVNKLFVQNPPYLKLSPEQEKALKQKWVDRLENGGE